MPEEASSGAGGLSSLGEKGADILSLGLTGFFKGKAKKKQQLRELMAQKERMGEQARLQASSGAPMQQAYRDMLAGFAQALR